MNAISLLEVCMGDVEQPGELLNVAFNGNAAATNLNSIQWIEQISRVSVHRLNHPAPIR